ncbi:MAG: polysaccharide pyruvyl transferase family protein [Staphylococcus equorum]|nr:polysaccharide pyruvyl transferase family protein [Staphylococcus equorum]
MGKRYLIRSGIAPTDVKTPEDMVVNPRIGGNVGNLIYAFSVYRNLTTENVEIIPDNYRINEEDATEINEKYDAYIIPLADAFREAFVKQLKSYTKLFKKLNIPVIVIGVGLRAPFEPNLEEGFSFDKEVKEFVKAVLEHSSMIGVRGQITADYLTSLGFKEGRDHMVIGCPSMYSFGPALNIRDTTITKDSLIALNGSKLSPDNVLKFTEGISMEYPNYYFIPQWQKELKMTYLGNEKLKKDTEYYPVDITHKFYEEDRVRFPINAKSWIDFLKTADLAVGSRLHGNITATIAGTPSLLIPKDARMRELTDYHHLTHIWADEITEETTLAALIEKVDFHSPEKRQKVNFDNFIQFLELNGLDHIYRHETEAPLDKKLEKAQLPSLVKPINQLEPEQLAGRLESYEKRRNKELKGIKEENKNYKTKDRKNKKKIRDLEKKNKHCKNVLDRKEIKIVRKLGDFLRKN